MALEDILSAVSEGYGSLSGLASEVFGRTPSFDVGNVASYVPPLGLDYSSEVMPGSVVPDLTGTPGGDWFSKIGGFAGDVGSKIGRAYEEDPLKAFGKTLGLGTEAFGIYAGAKGVSDAATARREALRAREHLERTAGPAAASGATLTGAGTKAMMGGPLPRQLESEVERWKDETRTRLRNYFAKAGITDSTMMAQMESWVEQQGNLLRQQYAQSLLLSGYQGVATALGPAQALVGEAGKEEGSIEKLLHESNRFIAQLTGAAA